MKYFGWIFIFFITLYIIPLGSKPLIAPVEFNSAETARQMIETDHYITASLPDQEAAKHTGVLDQWMISTSFKLFGINNFSARLPSALAVGITALLTALLIHQNLRDEKLAALSAIIYMSFSLVFVSGNMAVSLTIFTMFAAASAGMMFLALQETSFNRRKILLVCLSGIMTGLAFLSFGLPSLILPTLPVLFFAVFSKNLKKLLPVLPPYIVFAVLTILPWGLTAEKSDPGFWNAELAFYAQIFSDSIGNFSWYSYILVLTAGLFPITVLIPASIMTGRESWQKLFRQPICLFAVCMLAVPTVFMTIFRNMPPSLIIIGLPAAAILTALGLQAYFNNGGHHRSFDWMLNIWALLLLATGALETAVWSLREPFTDYLALIPISHRGWIILGVTSIAGGGLLLYSLRGNWRSRLYLFFFSVAIWPLGISWCFTPNPVMPEKTFACFLEKYEDDAKSAQFYTSAEYVTALSWCARSANVKPFDTENFEVPADQTSILIHRYDAAEAGLPFPKADSESCSGNMDFYCLIYRQKSTPAENESQDVL